MRHPFNLPIACILFFFLHQNGEAFSLVVNRVSLRDSFGPISDDNGNMYSLIHWNNGISSPALLPRNIMPAAHVELTVADPPSANVLVELHGVVPFRTFKANILVHPTSTYASVTAVADLPLPNYVGYNPAWGISWKWRTIDEITLEPTGPWTNIETTPIPTYICLGYPINAMLARTVIHNACATAGARTPDEAVANSWSRFSGKSVTT